MGKAGIPEFWTLAHLEAAIIGYLLTGEHGSHQAALDFLESRGYDVGSAGRSHNATSSSEQAGMSARREHIPTVESPTTEAGELQRKAEQEGVETLGHMERWRVACRLLKRGWNPAWEWFKEQFGAGFKSDITQKQFQSILNAYPDDYEHVEVPKRSS